MNKVINEIQEMINELVEFTPEKINTILDKLEELTKTNLIAYVDNNKLNIELSMNRSMYKLFENEYICNSINEDRFNVVISPYFKNYDSVEDIDNVNEINYDNVYVMLNEKVLYIYTKENIRGMENSLIRYLFNELEEIEYIKDVQIVVKKIEGMERIEEFKKSVKKVIIEDYYKRASFVRFSKVIAPFREDINDLIVYNKNVVFDYLYQSNIKEEYPEYYFISIRFINKEENPRRDREKFEKVTMDVAMKKLSYAAGNYEHEYGDYIVFTKEKFQEIMNYEGIEIFDIVTGEQVK